VECEGDYFEDSHCVSEWSVRDAALKTVCVEDFAADLPQAAVGCLSAYLIQHLQICYNLGEYAWRLGLPVLRLLSATSWAQFDSSKSVMAMSVMARPPWIPPNQSVMTVTMSVMARVQYQHCLDDVPRISNDCISDRFDLKVHEICHKMAASFGLLQVRGWGALSCFITQVGCLRCHVWKRSAEK
jgi:hypothetical protein